MQFKDDHTLLSKHLRRAKAPHGPRPVVVYGISFLALLAGIYTADVINEQNHTDYLTKQAREEQENLRPAAATEDEDDA